MIEWNIVEIWINMILRWYGNTIHLETKWRDIFIKWNDIEIKCWNYMTMVLILAGNYINMNRQWGKILSINHFERVIHDILVLKDKGIYTGRKWRWLRMILKGNVGNKIVLKLIWVFWMVDIVMRWMWNWKMIDMILKRYLKWYQYIIRMMLE